MSGHRKDIDDIQNTDRINDQQNNKPSFMAQPRGFPERNPFPNHGPNNEQEEDKGIG